MWAYYDIINVILRKTLVFIFYFVTNSGEGRSAATNLGVFQELLEKFYTNDH